MSVIARMLIVKKDYFMKQRILIFFLVFSPIVSAENYYVSPTGTNGTFPIRGTITNPWATLQWAFDHVTAGDTVFLRGGIYYQSYRAYIGSETSGTAEKPIVFMAYPDDLTAGNRPIIDGNSTSNSGGILCSSTEYLKFYGLVLRNFVQINPPVGTTYDHPFGFYIYKSSNITLEFCEVYEVQYRAFWIWESDEVYLINCDAHHIYDPLSDDPGDHADGFFIWDGSEINCLDYRVYNIGCRAWECADNGWDAQGDFYIYFENCWAFNNGRYEGLSSGRGSGFAIGYPNIQQEYVTRQVYNCVAAFNNSGGFATMDYGRAAIRPMELFNNIAYHNGFPSDADGIGFDIFNTTTTDYYELQRVFRNNIAYYNEDYDVRVASGALYTHSNNSWDTPGIAISDLDFLSVDSTGITAVRETDGSLPNNDCYNKFLKIAPGSDLIDSGTDVGLPYSGNAPDIGYSEYKSGSITPSIPVYLGSVIENSTPTKIELTYNLTLANIIPNTNVFTVKVNSSLRTVSTVTIYDTKVILTLSSPVVYDDIVTLAYTKPATNPLQTEAGGQAASISAQIVTNNCRLPANQPPISNISSPGKSSSFIAPATIELNADVYDPDGTISKVEFFNNSNKLAEISTAPYSFTWKDVPAGNYSITAVATDNLDGKGTSEPITVIVNNLTTTVNQLPVINITYPFNNSSFEIQQTITLTADATDPDGTINRVEYFNSSIKIGESFSSPFNVPFEINKEGSYEITAIAYDNLNGISSSSIKLYAILSKNDLDIIKLYPNPNNGQFAIDLMTPAQLEKNIVTIVDMTGRTVYKKLLQKEESSNLFDVSYLNSGIYILMIKNDEIIITKKFIKT